jgi:hypothetical protein
LEAPANDEATFVIQTACDRCTLGVMDADNPHLHGLCECECHPLVDPYPCVCGGPDTACPTRGETVRICACTAVYEVIANDDSRSVQ